MEQAARSPLGHFGRSSSGIALVALLALMLPACAAGPAELPDPRPIVIRSGARLRPEKEKMEVVDAWFSAETENIRDDPTFMIEVVPRDEPAYPWESLLIVADTAKIGVEQGKSPDAPLVYEIYAHLHLMNVKGRLDEFLPDASDVDGFDLEVAIVRRVAEAWLLGRSVFEAEAYDPLEELVYANEAGYLDALILTARGDEFRAERRAWLEENPEALEEYRQWFVDTFSREPPGLRETGTGAG